MRNSNGNTSSVCMSLQGLMWDLVLLAICGCQQNTVDRKHDSSDAITSSPQTVTPPDTDNEADNSDAKVKDSDDDEDEDKEAESTDDEEEAYLLVDGKKASSLTLPGKGRNKSLEIEVKSAKSGQKFVIMSVSYNLDQEVAISAEVDMSRKAFLKVTQRTFAQEGVIRVKVRNKTHCEKDDEIDCDDAGDRSDGDTTVTLRTKPKAGEKEAAEEAEAKADKEALQTGITIIQIIGAVMANGEQGAP